MKLTAWEHFPYSVRKAWRIMRITTLLILVISLHLSAKTTAQKITLSSNNISIEQFFNALEKQTGFSFLLENGVVSKDEKISVNVKDEQLETVLELILKPINLSYKIENKTVYILKGLLPTSTDAETSSPPGDIHGHITDSTGHPLVGVSITVKGSQIGTTTDANGYFTLTGIKDNATLIVSYIGYAKQQYKLRGQSSINISLIPYVSELDKVQVIAYGTTTQRFYTGDVSVVDAKVIEQQPVPNALLAMEGRVPGLEISQGSGLSGGNVNVLIRGGTSLLNGNDPLYVVDGVPYPSQLLPNLGAGLYNINALGPLLPIPNAKEFGNPLNYLNPLDIESISVLKDAAATSIYGSRAANGAIIITTKHGKVGETRVDINVQNGWGGVTRKLDLMNAQQYLAMRHEALKNDGLTIGPYDYDLNGTWDTTHITDWQKTLIGGTSQYFNLGAAVSGGNVSTQYTVGGNFHRETSVFPGGFANQNGSLHFNLNTKSSNGKFGLNFTGNYMVNDNELPAIDLTNTAITLPPVGPPLYTADGQLNWAPDISGSSSWQNPVAYLYSTYQNKANNLISNLVLNYHILPELELRASLGYTNLQANEIVTYPLTSEFPEERPYLPRGANYGYNNNNDWIVEPQINYKHRMGKGRLESLIGATIQQNNSHGFQMSGQGYSSDQQLEDIGSAAVVRVTSSLDKVYKYNALFGRVDYNWDDKYILDLTARRDGSSRFGAANQFHNFGALGLAWIFSQEGFVKDNLPFISFGKLRGSYGTTGNDQIGDYQFLSLYRPVNYSNPYQGLQSLIPEGLSNPYLEWEETRKLEIGVNLGFIKDRLIVSANYYSNRSSNQLLSYQLPNVTGFGSITQNFPATVQHSGWEFSLQVENVKKSDFEWSTSINLTIPESKLVAFPNLSTSGYARQYVIGKSTNIVRLYHFLGVNPATGIYQFDDGKGGVTSAPEINYPQSLASTVDLDPTYYGGIGNSFRYKGLELDFFFQFIKQIGQNYFFGAYIPGIINGGTANQPNYLTDRWQQPGMIANHMRYNSDGSLFGPFYDATQSDAAFSDASFIRLKNVYLSWSFPEIWMRKAHLRNFKIYVSGQNLFTITRYIGLDPENKSSTQLPPLRVLTTGLQIGL